MKYDEAGKFFINEMDLRRRSTQTPLSEKAFLLMYNVLGSYGEDIMKPFSFIIITIFLIAWYRFLASFMIQVPMPSTWIQNFLSFLDRSLRIFIQLGGRNGEVLDIWDTIERIWAVPLFALFVISLRRKLERRFRH